MCFRDGRVCWLPVRRLLSRNNGGLGTRFRWKCNSRAYCLQNDFALVIAYDILVNLSREIIKAWCGEKCECLGCTVHSGDCFRGCSADERSAPNSQQRIAWASRSRRRPQRRRRPRRRREGVVGRWGGGRRGKEGTRRWLDSDFCVILTPEFHSWVRFLTSGVKPPPVPDGSAKFGSPSNHP